MSPITSSHISELEIIELKSYAYGTPSCHNTHRRIYKVNIRELFVIIHSLITVNLCLTHNQPLWYTNIIRTLNTLAEEFGLDDLQTTKLRDTTMEIAKEQFQRGNKGGIRWVYDKLREKGIQVPS